MGRLPCASALCFPAVGGPYFVQGLLCLRLPPSPSEVIPLRGRAWDVQGSYSQQGLRYVS